MKVNPHYIFPELSTMYSASKIAYCCSCTVLHESSKAKLRHFKFHLANLILSDTLEETELSYFCIDLKKLDNRIASFGEMLPKFEQGSKPQFTKILS